MYVFLITWTAEVVHLKMFPPKLSPRAQKGQESDGPLSYAPLE